MNQITKNSTTITSLVPGALTLGFLLLAAPAQAELTVEASHERIDIGSFYHGSTVSVSGTCEPNTEIVVKISSPDAHAVLKKKGKVGGMLWMNVGELKFENEPNLYLLRSSAAIDTLVDHEQADKYVLGYGALERHVSIEPAMNDKERSLYFKEFIKYKTSNDLYAQESNGVAFVEKNGANTYHAVFQWPYQAQPGDYNVDVYAIRAGKVVETATAPVTVSQAGAVKFLADMARNNGALYGLVSIFVALFSGFGAGAIFKKGEGAH